ncbi:hypothetical protein V6N13_106783 [Hibiscus sabdariffa]
MGLGATSLLDTDYSDIGTVPACRQFKWKPYQEASTFVPDALLVDANLWCSVTPLIHFAIVEFQFADMVLRYAIWIPPPHYVYSH